MHIRYFFLLLIVGFLSCKKNSPDNIAPATRADITGFVNLYDENTTLLNNSGMQVSVQGSSPSISAITDANGKFILSNVPFGTYTLVYEKTGYGIYKKPGVVHSTDGSPTFITNTASLGKTSTTTVTNLTASQSGSNILIAATTNPAGSLGNTRYIRYFLSPSATVSKDNYSYVSSGFVSQINPYQATLTSANLIAWGFTSGQTVFVKVYGDAFWSNEYQDPTTGQKVFPNLNDTSANSVSFIVP
jgi:hypothetical protein